MITLEIETVADNGATLAAKVIEGADFHDAFQKSLGEVARLASIWPEAHHCILDEDGDTIQTGPAAARAWGM